ncbi:hypothetical protein G6F43_008720 [Rhizopus delemar]|nr:hypothetical protein G6F43_008720 [Rhizopus delemar]
MQARLFFTYDISLQRIRPLLRPDSSHCPRPAAWLLRDINSRIITLNGMIWALILNLSPDLGQVDVYPFVSRLIHSPDWILYNPKVFWQNQIAALDPGNLITTLSSADWVRFWSLKMLPEARSLCFRFLFDKLHCQLTIAHFNPDVSSACKLCKIPREDIHHLVISCPYKWPIWQKALSRFVPYLEFNPEDIHEILGKMRRYEHVDNTKLLILSYYVMLFI